MVSLYGRIESLLRNKILSGQFEPGEKLPPEHALVKQFGVSKITIRNALSHLEANGLIVRNAGKGTFVSERIPVTKQFVVTRSVDDMVLDAERYEVRLNSIQTVKVGETRIARYIREFFKLSSEDEVAKIQRVRLLKGIAINLLENFLPVDIAKHFTEQELSKKPLLKILKEKTGLTIGRGEMYIEAIPADPDIAEILQCQTYDPLIFKKTYYWFTSNDPFEMIIGFMRPEYFIYKIDIETKSFQNV